MVNSIPNGFGLLKTQAGEYLSVFKDGHLGNFLLFKRSEGDSNLAKSYFGYVSNDQLRHGLGRLKDQYDIIYEGLFKNDLPHGYVVVTYPKTHSTFV